MKFLDDLDKELGGVMCFHCRHYHEFEACTCDAFPDGIPEEVWHEEHYDPYPGDNGIVFDELSEKEIQERKHRMQNGLTM